MESVVAMLASGHASRGHSVRVACVISPTRESNPFVDALQERGVNAIPVRVGDRDYRGERKFVRDLCRGDRPDVVHTHGFRPDVIDGGVAHAERIPTVSTCHGFIEFGFRGAVYQWLQRRALRRYEAVVAVSEAIASTLRRSGVPPARIDVVLNAFGSPTERIARDSARALLNLPDEPVVAWVGRFSAEKGPDIAIDAFARLRHPTARLLMIGEGREESALRNRAGELGLAQRIIWAGPVPNVGRLFSAFDAFLLSSRTEGTPMVLLEAMAAGVPIVASLVGGVGDVVDASCAWLAPPLDPRALAHGIDEALSNRRLTDERTQRASERLHQRFAMDPWLSRYESIYRAIAKSRR
jgi:glycosyltransferase involved in cell wall biosynthesis